MRKKYSTFALIHYIIKPLGFAKLEYKKYEL